MAKWPKTIIAILLVAGCVPSSGKRSDYSAKQEAERSGSEQTISILAWNVESGGNDSKVIASQLAELTGYEIYCLCEVRAANFRRYEDALGPDFDSFNSTTGRDDRLQIIYDKTRFELLQKKELHRHGGTVLNNGAHRSPIFVRLRDRKLGLRFIVMTNHLARRDVALRRQQAAGLREWARKQSTAVINVGDFNMDYDFVVRNGNESFVEILRDNVYLWVKPTQFIDTQWSDIKGKDRYPNSMLDFAFVAGPAKEWNPVSRVVVRDGDFPDDERTSDHRPIELKLTFP